MKFALVDDEQLQLNILKQTLTSALASLGLEAESIECFPGAESFLAKFEANKTNDDSLGIIGIASASPIVSVLLYGIILKIANGGRACNPAVSYFWFI